LVEGGELTRLSIRDWEVSQAWDLYDFGLMLKEVEKNIAEKRAAIISVSSHLA
jgi:hypothetical protein